jgi:hypothetical protein
MRSGLITAVAVATLALGVPLWAQAQAPQPAKPGAPEIDLKLFEKSEKEVDRTKGCTVALWQASRDPDKDQYAFLLVEQLRGRDHARDPARIRVGAVNVPLTRIATGGKTNGYGLYEYQLYKTPDGDGYVVLDLKLGELEGEAVEIESGKMMVAMLGKETFRASVKGGAGCMGAPLPLANAAAPKTAAAPAVAAPRAVAPAAKLPPGPAMFERYKVEPALFSPGFRREVQKKFKCSPDVMKTGVVGYQMSEESAIWEIPCDRFAYQGSSIFALVYISAPEKEHTFLTTPGPPGHKRTSDPGVLMSPKWDIKSRVVTSVSLGRGAGDCGVLEKYRVTPEGQFALVEYREKTACDGVETLPEQYPQIFPKR